MKLRGHNIDTCFFVTQLPLNEDDKCFEEQFNDIDYKKTVKHYIILVGGEISLTSTDVSMLGYGFGVSQYPQFYVKALDMYQVLPRPYLGSFDGFPGNKLIKKEWV